jgi:pimeloyl-ACP methyl ester carboxylesterase
MNPDPLPPGPDAPGDGASSPGPASRPSEPSASAATPGSGPARTGAQRLVRDLHGASRLATDATLGLTDLVENLHHNILRVPAPLGRASQARTRGITGLVYRSIRGVTRLVGGTADALLGQLASLLATPQAVSASEQREALIAALNGVLGDHLAATGNPLAVAMSLRHDGLPLVLQPEALSQAVPEASPRVLLMLHGLCMHPGQWRRMGLDIGRTLAEEGARTLLHAHYNTGLHVAANGRALADQLQSLAQAWPLSIEDLTIIGHSMGGLVARSALHQARELGHGWPQRVRRLVFLGTPHHGAPLERGGRGIDALLAASPYTAAFGRLGRVRSAGITDLRHGSLLDADRSGPDRFAHAHDTRSPLPLPSGVACYALAGALGQQPGRLRQRWMGDGLVPVDSALGRHADAARGLDFLPGHVRVIEGLGHLDLLGHAEVLEQLRTWLNEPLPA